MREIETDLLNNDPGGVLSMTMPKLHTLTAYLLSDLAIALFTVGIASPFLNIAPNRYNKVKTWNFFLFTSLVKTVLKLLT